MHINVPLVRQPKDSSECWLAGLAMILQYYRIEKNYEEISQSIEVFENIGTFTPQLGSYMIKQGFDVELVSQNPFLFTLADREKSQKEILIKFKELLPKVSKERNRKILQFFIEFMEQWGEINVKIPDITDVKNELASKRPVIALMTTNFLQNVPGFNFHFTVVTGYNENKNSITVNDPLWNERWGEYSYDVDDFFYGIHASTFADPDNAGLMLFKKKWA